MAQDAGDPPNGQREKPDRGGFLAWVGIGIKGVVTAFLALIAVIQGIGYISSERAIVFPEAVALPSGLGNIDPQPIRFDMKNGGKSVATIKEVAAAISHGLPANPGEMTGVRFGSPPVVPGGTTKRTFLFEVARGGYPPETVTRLKNGNLKFYFFGVIRYSDWLNFPSMFGFRETGFCFQYIGSQDAFETCDNPAFSYAT